MYQKAIKDCVGKVIPPANAQELKFYQAQRNTVTETELLHKEFA